MSAYVIADVNWKDVPLSKRQEFIDAGRPATVAYGGKILCSTGQPEPIEGGWAPKMVQVIEFESPERAKAFLTSDEFQKAVAIRRATDAEFKVVLVPGI